MWKEILILHEFYLNRHLNITVFEARIQRLLDGLLFVGKGFGMHVQRMLKMSKVYTLAEICKKKTKGNWGP